MTWLLTNKCLVSLSRGRNFLSGDKMFNGSSSRPYLRVSPTAEFIFLRFVKGGVKNGIKYESRRRKIPARCRGHNETKRWVVRRIKSVREITCVRGGGGGTIFRFPGEILATWRISAQITSYLSMISMQISAIWRTGKIFIILQITKKIIIWLLVE